MDLRQTIDSLRPEELWRSSRIKWNLHGDGVLPAWVADMDFPVAPAVQDALHDLVERSDLGYHHVPLSPQLRRALVTRMAERFDWAVEPRRIAPLVNVIQGLDAAVLLYTEPGDGVIVQTPIYPPFLACVEGTGRRLVENPLLPGRERYEIDFDRLRADIDGRTRLLMLCNPHNPTGRVFTRAELLELGEIALEHDLIVVADEIHADLALSGHTHLPFANLSPDLRERTVTLTSASKAFNLAGVPCAFAIFGSDRLQKPFRDQPPHLLGHCGILDDAATTAAWTHGQPWLDAVLAYLLENRTAVMDFLSRELAAIQVLPPEATYLAWLDCRALGLPKEPVFFFREEAKVALSPGPDFGTPGQGFVRLNFATSSAILAQILERMAEAVRAA
jgi:cystathionine beta-lyase